VEVRWPGSRTQKIDNPGIDRYMEINEQEAKAKE
jgi:hypothetical protein